MLYHVGDFVLCRISEDETIIFDVEYSDKRYKHLRSKYFEVISIQGDKYIILSEKARGDFVIKFDRDLCFEFGLSESFLNKKAYAVREKAIGGRRIIDFYTDALRCSCCKEPVPYAVPNYPNNIFICFVCRNDPRLKFKIEKLLG